jgi:indole-3-glycerol phosphate synthase
VPLLAKEFVLDEAQLDWAGAAGADAVLLIARILPAARLGALHRAARARGLTPVVEVATEEELSVAEGCGAAVIGVNARDLDTLVMDAERAAHILSRIPREVVRLHLSGIRTEVDAASVARGGVDGALIGEGLMRVADPRPLLRALLAAGSSPQASG